MEFQVGRGVCDLDWSGWPFVWIRLAASQLVVLRQVPRLQLDSEGLPRAPGQPIRVCFAVELSLAWVQVPLLSGSGVNPSHPARSF